MTITKRLLVLTVILAGIISCKESSTGSEGSLIQTTSIQSDVMDMEVNYSVYLPNSYGISKTDFPILYLFHGFGGNNRDWPQNGVKTILDKAIEEGDLPELIVVMPDGMDSFYLNDYDQRGLKYEDFFVDEFIPAVESKYRVDAVKEKRGIAGLSMGGYGATYHAFKRPELFTFAYSMSGAIGIGGNTVNIQNMLEAKSASELKELPAFTLDCGASDFLYQNNVSFGDYLTTKEIEHEFITRNGSHTWEYWTESLPRALKRLGTALN